MISRRSGRAWKSCGGSAPVSAETWRTPPLAPSAVALLHPNWHIPGAIYLPSGGLAPGARQENAVRSVGEPHPPRTDEVEPQHEVRHRAGSCRPQQSPDRWRCPRRLPVLKTEESARRQARPRHRGLLSIDRPPLRRRSHREPARSCWRAWSIFAPVSTNATIARPFRCAGKNRCPLPARPVLISA
jgi:hypothetical protein